jgi:uncharacterized protein (UPF0264 family)
MRLLVSVRSAVEVAPAVAGGTDIIDAKEPARGSLGPVDPAVLRSIVSKLPAGMPLSVALGDPGDAAAVIADIDRLDRASPQRECYVKLGSAGQRAAAPRVLARAVAAAARTALSPRVVAVAYADSGRADALDRFEVLQMASEAGADGVLLDTYMKDGTDLFGHADPAAVAEWAAAARQRGLLVAIAGSLSARALSLLDLPADIVGVRGAACEGGREGSVSETLVRRIKSALSSSRIAFPGSDPAPVMVL